MSTLTLLRLYIKMQSMPRLPLPHFGYTGTLYVAPLTDRQRFVFRENCVQTTAQPELGSSGLHMRNVPLGFHRRHYSTSASQEDIKKAEKERAQKKKFKLQTAETIKVLVVNETGNISSMTLIEANKLAKKKGLNLVHIVRDQDKPIRTEKQVYKLEGRLESIKDESDDDVNTSGSASKQPQKAKEEKTVLVKSNIGAHDINAKINVMKKWITKGHRIRVVISQAGNSDPESVFRQIETGMAEIGMVQQKITKGADLRFYVGPPKISASNKKLADSKSTDNNNKKRDNKTKATGTGSNENQSDTDDDESDSDDEKPPKKSHAAKR